MKLEYAASVERCTGLGKGDQTKINEISHPIFLNQTYQHLRAPNQLN